jgi:hypothetical protein
MATNGRSSALQAVQPPVDWAKRALDRVRREGAFPYNSSAAGLLAVASAWAYSDAETLARIMALSGMGGGDEAKVVVRNIHARNGAILVDAQAYLIQSTMGDENVGILVFRGTQFGTAEFTDILTSTTLETTEYPPNSGASVHVGYFRSFSCVWDGIRRLLTQDENRDRQFFFAGHSLGGALAAIAGSAFFWDDDFSDLWPNFRGLYTYGQPMVGDAIFASLCDERLELGDKTFRHVYHRDWVPRFPPRTTGSFQHFGKEYYGTKTRGWSERTPALTQAWSALAMLPIAALAFVAEQFPLGRKVKFNYSMADHIPQNYIDCSKVQNPRAVFP